MSKASHLVFANQRWEPKAQFLLTKVSAPTKELPRNDSLETVPSCFQENGFSVPSVFTERKKDSALPSLSCLKQAGELLERKILVYTETPQEFKSFYYRHCCFQRTSYQRDLLPQKGVVKVVKGKRGSKGVPELSYPVVKG
jgi:hypothetical protein